MICIDDLPANLQSRAFEQMKALALSESAPNSSRSHAAMCVAECFAIGFAVAWDKEQLLHWVLKAAELGSRKANSWYLRLCSAMHVSPIRCNNTLHFARFEEELSTCTSETYLIGRIRLQRNIIIDQVTAEVLLKAPNDFFATITLFDTWIPDEIAPVHVAALIGDNDTAYKMVLESTAGLRSSGGFNGIHYACIGGHIETLELFLSHDAAHAYFDGHGISPLHLCVFFDDQDVAKAVKLLLQKGADPHAQSRRSGLKWECHDLLLRGSALDWAVQCRHRQLVNVLLPFTQDYKCLEEAVSCSYWEIVEDILIHFDTRNDISRDIAYLYYFPRPFLHWIVHGKEHNDAVRKTAGILKRYKHGFDELDNPEVSHGLFMGINLEAQLVHLDAWIHLLPDAKLKETSSDQKTALSAAIDHATSHDLWVTIIRKLVDLYTVEELEANVLLQGSYLHLAVMRDSVIGARILLEKGVNVNQRTFDTSKDTPLHTCITIGKSRDLYDLLLEYGADLNATSTHFHTTPHQSLFILPDFKASDAVLALEACKTSSDFAEILGRNFSMQLHSTNEGFREYFKALLRSHYMAEYINQRNEYGATMIHVAAFLLDPDTINVLLEAGADASLLCGEGSDSLLPLQIACRIGRRFWRHPLPDAAILRRRKEAAMTVASELLQWYRAHRSALFKGITKLHLACHMGIEEEVRKLIMAGQDRNGKGVWPGLDGEVDARELHDRDSDRVPPVIFLGDENVPELSEIVASEYVTSSKTRGRIDELFESGGY
jgi:ankyrin repeat protein